VGGQRGLPRFEPAAAESPAADFSAAFEREKVVSTTVEWDSNSSSSSGVLAGNSSRAHERPSTVRKLGTSLAGESLCLVMA